MGIKASTREERANAERQYKDWDGISLREYCEHEWECNREHMLNFWDAYAARCYREHREPRHVAPRQNMCFIQRIYEAIAAGNLEETTRYSRNWFLAWQTIIEADGGWRKTSFDEASKTVVK
jgi:hypothetical protein